MTGILKRIDGRLHSKESIVERYAGLVHHIAIRHTGEYEKEDLVSEGFIGLLLAYERFDGSSKIPFVRYANKYINGQMLKLKRKSKQGPHYPHDTVTLGWKIFKHGFEEKSVGFIAYALNVPKAHAERALKYLQNRSPERLDKPYPDGQNNLHDSIGNTDDFSELDVEEFIATLDERERTVVDCLYQDMKQREICQLIGVSQMHTSRIITKIRKKYNQYQMEGVS